MKKLVLSAAVLAVFTGGMTAAVSVVAAPAASACAYQVKTSSALAAKLPQVKYHDRGQHVLALQLALRGEGYSYLRGTGTYADETLRAVKDFQRKHGIKASGIVGSKTWQALVGKKPETQTGNSLHVVPNFTLQPNERNQEKMDTLVNMLTRISPYADQLSENLDWSYYSPAIQKMVRDFQKRAGIKASGIIGPKTVAAMNEVIAVTARWGC